ncbi:hypothetical protein [Pseudomonas fluorescens]|jgi:hypothetical protein|uniref:Uncharacterized protein n=1 Tax=Pseudomonas fluorescens TaxID=294 RepID=A0A5E7IDF6_PSEFL|nr:hypothetical protein [Pseudomonas fluorescens]VVO69753.1 hypothetical protein PS847_01243 [Pseudomonas fluorescens]
MTIDKQKLQKLLWAEAASFRADCADWKRNTEALQEFLGEKTVEEVALELLAENERLATQVRLAGVSAEVTVHQEVGRAITETLALTIERDRLKAENEVLRSIAEKHQIRLETVRCLLGASVPSDSELDIAICAAMRVGGQP